MKYSELIEKKRHGKPSFPIEYYHIDKNHPRYVMPLHWHREYEIVRVISGSLTMYLGNTKYELSRGDCLFIEGGCLQCGYPSSCEYECLVFDAGILNSKLGAAGQALLDFTTPDVRYVNFISHENEKICAVIDELLRSVSVGADFFEIKTVGLLYSLIYEMYLGGYIYKSKAAASDKGMQAVIAAIGWIDAHHSEKITLRDVSKAVGFSEKYICRIFKEYTSKTVMDYINECRIEKACAQMMKGSVTDAAFSCGFNDLSYFCKTFKKYKNMTPSEYKRIEIRR